MKKSLIFILGLIFLFLCGCAAQQPLKPDLGTPPANPGKLYQKYLQGKKQTAHQQPSKIEKELAALKRQVKKNSFNIKGLQREVEVLPIIQRQEISLAKKTRNNRRATAAVKNNLALLKAKVNYLHPKVRVKEIPAFKAGKVYLTARIRRALDLVGQEAQQGKIKVIKIIGLASYQPPNIKAEKNLAVSRAEAAKRYLKKKWGVDCPKIEGKVSRDFPDNKRIIIIVRQ